MNDPHNKNMEQFHNRDDGDLHLYKDQDGKLWYLIEQIDDVVGNFISAETPEGQPPEKVFKGLSSMKHQEDIKYYEGANTAKVNPKQTIPPATKPAKGKWHGWGCAGILLILFALIFWGIQYSNNKQEQQATKDTEQIIQLHNDWNDRAWKDYNRVIGLLSVKYSFSDSIVKLMILEYLRINEPSKYNILTMYDKNRDTTVFDYILKPKESIIVTIQSLNRQNSISKDTISSLLLDFEIWLQTKEK